MQILKDEDVVFIIRNMLGMIDERLVTHGERVTYLVMKMMESLHYSQEEIMRGCLLSLFHDIGAFKTEDIDDLLTFEKDDVWHHAIYGYLFLRTFTPLSPYADCILYHHTPYHRLLQIDCSWTDFAALLHFCDRVDTLITSGKEANQQTLFTIPGRFKAEHIECFLQLDEQLHLCAALRSDAYQKEIYEVFPTITFSPENKHQYLQMIAYAIDFNSEFTVLHTILTTSVAIELGKQLHFSEEALARIYYGALLHDVGKCAIPISILEKPGKLTASEMNIMRTHVVASERVLKGRLPEDILQIAIRHHEKLDGSGYPYGLEATQLTPPERLVAVADIISALLGKRSYKDAFAIDQIIAILTTMAEQHKIDLDIVHTFIQHHEEILTSVYKSSKPIELMYEDMLQEYHTIASKIKQMQG